MGRNDKFKLKVMFSTLKKKPVYPFFKINFDGFAPSYIEDLVYRYVLSRSLRSTSQGLLTLPRSTTSTYGDRAFSIAAPRL